jgi:hypothetical protein
MKAVILQAQRFAFAVLVNVTNFATGPPEPPKRAERIPAC